MTRNDRGELLMVIQLLPTAEGELDDLDELERHVDPVVKNCHLTTNLAAILAAQEHAPQGPLLLTGSLASVDAAMANAELLLNVACGMKGVGALITVSSQSCLCRPPCKPRLSPLGCVWVCRRGGCRGGKASRAGGTSCPRGSPSTTMRASTVRAITTLLSLCHLLRIRVLDPTAFPLMYGWSSQGVVSGRPSSSSPRRLRPPGSGGWPARSASASQGPTGQA